MAKKGKKKTQQDMKTKVSTFLKSKKLGLVLGAIEAVLALVFIGMVTYLNMLPLKYFLPIVVIIIMVSAYIFLSMFLKKFRTFGKILAVIFSIIWIFGIYMVGYASGTFDKVGGAKTKADVVNVYVMKEDAAENVKDAAGYTFGKLSSIDKENTEKTVEDINKEIGSSIVTKDYTTMEQLAGALYSGEVQAIIMNQAYADALKDIDGYTEFADRTKVIYGNTIKTEIKVVEDVDVTSNAFAVYISGIDTTGPVSTTSRSDVNIIAIVNPDTREILLVNTPRDYYVPLSISNGVRDKLTHAGIYGIDVSMDTLGMLYGIDVNYFFRLNFTGFTGIIDALGGIDVTLDYDATLQQTGYLEVHRGENHFNGSQALVFARERYAYTDGDRQRGRNQMMVISSVVKRMASPALLNNYAGLMDSISGSFETSLSSAQISDLVRMQLNEGGGWNVQQYSVTGTGDMASCYSVSSGEYYVMRPDENTVAKAKELIQKVYSGETLTSEDLAE